MSEKYDKFGRSSFTDAYKEFESKYGTTTFGSGGGVRKDTKKEVTDADRAAMKETVVDVLFDGMKLNVEQRLQETVEEITTRLLGEFQEQVEELKSITTVNIQFKDHDESSQVMSHAVFPTLMKAISTGLPVMLVGPAGTGKTFAAMQAAEVMKLNFYAMSVGSQTSKSDIGGYMNAVGDYVRSQFRDAYEHGGVFLMDEIDAGNSNVLIFINAALSSSMCAFPDQMVTKHANFHFVATANTYGMGANRQYVGRNQLDAATLDRFITIDWPIDKNLEKQLIQNTTHGHKWLKVVEEVRSAVETSEYRLIISPRATIKGASLLEAGVDFETTLKSVILSQATIDQRKVLTESATKAWGN